MNLANSTSLHCLGPAQPPLLIPKNPYMGLSRDSLLLWNIYYPRVSQDSGPMCKVWRLMFRGKGFRFIVQAGFAVEGFGLSV